MRHPYSETCECKNCLKERQRRLDQSNSKKYFEKKYCRDTRTTARHASRAEQHGRYLDCGPLNWDDR